jgi:hypothetical protein
VYQEVAAEERAAARAAPADVGTLRDGRPLPAALAAMPAEWRQELRGATILGSLESITAVLARAGEYDAALAEALQEMAQDYRHDSILALLEQAGGEDG